MTRALELLTAEADRLATAIYDSAIRRNIQPLAALPILVAGKFKEPQWQAAADAAGCELPDEDARTAVVKLLEEKVRAT